MPEQTYMISSSGEGDVCVSADVLNRIVSTAVGEVDGVAGLAAGIGPDVAEYLGYSKPSVSRAMGILRKEEYLTVDDSGGITLTEKGSALAEMIYERHTLLARTLMKLGVPEEIAVNDACKIEHDISPETFEAIKRHVAGHENG